MRRKKESHQLQHHFTWEWRRRTQECKIITRNISSRRKGRRRTWSLHIWWVHGPHQSLSSELKSLLRLPPLLPSFSPMVFLYCLGIQYPLKNRLHTLQELFLLLATRERTTGSIKLEHIAKELLLLLVEEWWWVGGFSCCGRRTKSESESLTKITILLTNLLCAFPVESPVTYVFYFPPER